MEKSEIKSHLKKIYNKFKKAGGIYLFYNANDLEDNFKAFVIGNTEEEIEEKLNSKIEKDYNKYKDYKLTRVFINISEGNIGRDKDDFVPGVGGALGISVMMYSINKFKRVNNTKNDYSATFWYDDDDIENFSMKHIKKAIKIVINNLVSSNPFATHYIKDMDSILKKKKKKKN
tara:strand:+ start:186 stop:707 length:522 start_codon:yes stop_codon:yes gene_type:complete